MVPVNKYQEFPEEPGSTGQTRPHTGVSEKSNRVTGRGVPESRGRPYDFCIRVKSPVDQVGQHFGQLQRLFSKHPKGYPLLPAQKHF